MAAITSFPSIVTTVLQTGDNQYTFKAGATLKAGQVVQMGTVDSTVIVAALANTATPIGVVDQDASSGDDDVTVNLWGTVCRVANADDTTDIDAGEVLKVTANTNCDGTVQAAGWSGAEYIVGIALTPIDGGGWGECLVLPYFNSTV